MDEYRQEFEELSAKIFDLALECQKKHPFEYYKYVLNALSMNIAGIAAQTWTHVDVIEVLDYLHESQIFYVSKFIKTQKEEDKSGLRQE